MNIDLTDNAFDNFNKANSRKRSNRRYIRPIRKKTMRKKDKITIYDSHIKRRCEPN